jgi:serine acetyltransferase
MYFVISKTTSINDDVRIHKRSLIGDVHSNAHKVIAGFFLSSDPEVT